MVQNTLVLTLAVLIGFSVVDHQPPTEWEKMNVKDAFDRLITAINKKHPELNLGHIKGLDPAEIAEIRKALPEAPAQLFELLRYHDFSSPVVFDPIDLYPPRDFKRRIQHEIDTYNRLGFADTKWHATASSNRCCKHDTIWREKWIPIGNFNGDAYFIDMDPADGGVPGQIVTAEIDFWCLEVRAYSIAHWLNRIADNIEQGKTDAEDYHALVDHKLPPARQEQ